jgi:hypothetical protein
VVDARRRDLRRAAAQAQNAKTASFFSHKRPFGGLSDQLAHGLAKCQPVSLRVRPGHLHGIVLELQRRSRHANIISWM